MIILRQKKFGLFSKLLGSRKNSHSYDNIPNLVDESKLPPEYKKVKAVEEELKKIDPNLGDGDEYMHVDTFSAYIDDENPDIFRYVISTPQRLSFDYDTKNRCWIDNDTGKRITFSQIKKALLDEVNWDIKDWKENQYWENDENEKVITFLEKEKKLIQTRL